MSVLAHERIAVAYEAHFEKLRYIATQMFRVPEADVKALIHDVFVRYIPHATLIGDDAAWLVTATKHACLNYWRDLKPTCELPEMPDTRQLLHDATVRVELARVLRRIPKQCRSVLWWRYVENRAPGDIAEALAKNRTYGRQIVHRCLTAARVAVASLVRSPR
ncbi:MAG TPA: sigma-70 family RNA polymerase sigma factor [Thermoanaerobaculia bacterium]|jgi:DNA-directed RNA polymerase specialized sigma24 family protein|nr:sigma-70 family RNA polymerase sigma factor [Thermoanaerobaculia bacterium]